MVLLYMYVYCVCMCVCKCGVCVSVVCVCKCGVCVWLKVQFCMPDMKRHANAILWYTHECPRMQQACKMQ